MDQSTLQRNLEFGFHDFKVVQMWSNQLCFAILDIAERHETKQRQCKKNFVNEIQISGANYRTTS